MELLLIAKDATTELEMLETRLADENRILDRFDTENELGQATKNADEIKKDVLISEEKRVRIEQEITKNLHTSALL
ncbi:MAG: hypothetical protein AAF585_22660, partial [Verrucomicrobiota bacterium]